MKGASFSPGSSIAGARPLFRSLMYLIPTIAPPTKEISAQKRVTWTFASMMVYIALFHLPLFGVSRLDKADALGKIRMSLASNYCTVFDLGLAPMITSFIVLKMLSVRIIWVVDKGNKDNVIAYIYIRRVVTLLAATFQASVQLISGQYGSLGTIGVTSSLLIIFQLIFASIIISLLDELIISGYGIGNTEGHFMIASTGFNVVWNALSPCMVETKSGRRPRGSLLHLFYFVFFCKKKSLEEVTNVLFGNEFPNLALLFFELLFFILLVYLYGMGREFRTESTHQRGCFSTYKMRLFNCSLMPIMMCGTVVAHVVNISRLMFVLLPDVLATRIMGSWKHSGGRFIPVGGICALLYPSASVHDVIERPISHIGCSIMAVPLSVLFSMLWVNWNDGERAAISNGLRKSRMKISGVNQSNMTSFLNKKIPMTIFLSGMLTGVLLLLSNMLGIYDIGLSAIVCVSVMTQYSDSFDREVIRYTRYHISN